MAEQRPLKWGDVWRIARDRNSPAGKRAARETGIVLGVAIAPLLFGAFFAWIFDRKDGTLEHSLYYYFYYGILGGQLMLVFLSLAGTNFSRLWDPQAPKIEFTGLTNGVALAGALLTAGLLGMDSTMSQFAFFPVNMISVALFGVAIVHYFSLAVPAYVLPGNSSDSSRKKGEKIAEDLDKVPVQYGRPY